MTTALVVVDVQNDFTTGSLAVAGGPQAALNIANYIEANDNHATKTLPLQYDFKVATMDWHVDPGTHWAPEGTEPNFVDTWPVHCKVGTDGAEFDPAVADIDFDAVFRKGKFAACYSGFEGTLGAMPGNPDLDEWLRKRDVTCLIVGGIATDYCVLQTVLDARRLGYDVTLATDLCAGVAEETTNAAIEQMREAGAKIV